MHFERFISCVATFSDDDARFSMTIVLFSLVSLLFYGLFLFLFEKRDNRKDVAFGVHKPFSGGILVLFVLLFSLFLAVFYILLAIVVVSQFTKMSWINLFFCFFNFIYQSLCHSA